MKQEEIDGLLRCIQSKFKALRDQAVSIDSQIDHVENKLREMGINYEFSFSPYKKDDVLLLWKRVTVKGPWHLMITYPEKAEHPAALCTTYFRKAPWQVQAQYAFLLPDFLATLLFEIDHLQERYTNPNGEAKCTTTK